MSDIEADKMLQAFTRKVTARQNLRSLAGNSTPKEKSKRGVGEVGKTDNEEQQPPFKPSVDK